MRFITAMLWLGLATPAMAGGYWSPTTKAGVDGFNDCVKALNAGEYDAAIAASDRAVAAEPKCWQCRLPKLIGLVALNRSAEAVELGELITKKYPKEAVAWSAYANALFVEERPEDSAAAGKRAIETSTTEGDRLNSANIYLQALLRLGDHKRAVAMIHKYREPANHPTWACLEVRAHAEAKALDQAAAALEICEKSSVEGQIRSSRSFLANARGEEPPDESGFKSAGSTTAELLQSGEAAKAEALARAQIDAEPKNQGARAQLGFALYNQKKYNEAAEQFALAVDGTDWVQSEDNTYTGILTASMERKRQAFTAQVANTYVTTLVLTGRESKARSELARLAQTLGKDADLSLGEAHVIGAESGAEAGWRALAKAAQAIEETDLGLLEGAQAAMALRHRDKVPADVLMALNTPPLSRMYIALNRQQHELCLTLATQALADGGDTTQAILQTGLACHGAHSTDLDEAMAWWGQLNEPAALHQGTRFNLAVSFQRGERHDQALTLLQGLTGFDSITDEILNHSRLTSLVGLERFDEALALASQGPVPTTAALWVSDTLGQAGRYQDALDLSAKYCPLATGEDAERCQHNRQVFENRLK